MIKATLYSQSPICDTASPEMSKRNGRFRSAARMVPAAAFCLFMDLFPFAVPVLSLFTIGLRGGVSHRPAAVTRWSPGLRFPASSPRGRAPAADTKLGQDVGHVHAGRLRADEQRLRDLRIRPADREQQHLPLARGEPEAAEFISGGAGSGAGSGAGRTGGSRADA